jgi:hypothetical protein
VGRCGQPGGARAFEWPAGCREAAACSTRTGQRGRRTGQTRETRERHELRQEGKGSRAVPEARGQVVGGPVYSEGGQQSCAHQVLDDASASQSTLDRGQEEKDRDGGMLGCD